MLWVVLSVYIHIIGIGSAGSHWAERAAVKRLNLMNEASVYIVERNAWSIVGHCDVHFRLTYEREFLPVQNLWRDFLVHCEEIGSVLPTANQFSAGK